MSSRATLPKYSRFHSIKQGVRSRFPHLGVDLLKILVAIVCGVGFASLFAWNGNNDSISITAPSIFLHNIAIALLTLLLTHYGAIVMIVLNGFWLGMGLVASTAAVGFHQTLALTMVHLPLEVLAWALTIQAARLFYPILLSALRNQDSWRQAIYAMRRALSAPILFYFFAAITEWAEHILLGR